MLFVSQLLDADTSRTQPARKTPVTPLQARASAIVAATQEANARRLAAARARAAAIIADAEQTNAEFLKLAEEQAAQLLASLPPTRRQQARSGAEPVANAASRKPGTIEAPRAEDASPEAPPAAREPEVNLVVAPEPPAAAREPEAKVVLAPEAVAAPAPVARIHPELGAIDGGVDLIVGPFARFSQLAAFTRGVRGLAGVISLDTREFLKGTVHLRLRYDDAIPLSVRLSELSEFRPVVLEASSGRVELRVNLVDSAAEADGIERAA
jgi:vacuolar-type H+-ATPase subunit H